MANKNNSGQYRQKRSAILTESEKRMYNVLREAFPEHIINSQVALSQLVSTDDYRDFNKISRLVLDFVVTNLDHQPIACIELDDWTHLRTDRQDADDRKNKALIDAGYLILRFTKIPTADEVLRSLEDARNPQPTEPAYEKYLKPLAPLQEDEIQKPERVYRHTRKYSWDTRGTSFNAPLRIGLIILGIFFLHHTASTVLNDLGKSTIERQKEIAAQQKIKHDQQMRIREENAPRPQQPMEPGNSALAEKTWTSLGDGLLINLWLTEKHDQYVTAFIKRNNELEKVSLNCDERSIRLSGRWISPERQDYESSKIVNAACY